MYNNQETLIQENVMQLDLQLVTF